MFTTTCKACSSMEALLALAQSLTDLAPTQPAGSPSRPTVGAACATIGELSTPEFLAKRAARLAAERAAQACSKPGLKRCLLAPGSEAAGSLPRQQLSRGLARVKRTAPCTRDAAAAAGGGGGSEAAEGVSTDELALVRDWQRSTAQRGVLHTADVWLSL
jgi:hypothetical protein